MTHLGQTASKRQSQVCTGVPGLFVGYPVTSLMCQGLWQDQRWGFGGQRAVREIIIHYINQNSTLFYFLKQ